MQFNYAIKHQCNFLKNILEWVSLNVKHITHQDYKNFIVAYSYYFVAIYLVMK